MKEKELTSFELLEALYDLAKERAAAADIDVIDVKVSDEELLNRVWERRLR